MQHLILKQDIPQNKLEALIHFLKSWDIEAEIKTYEKTAEKKKSKFSLSAGMWKNNTVDANELRKQAWSKKI